MPFFARLSSRFSGAGSLVWSATSDDGACPTSRQLYELNALSFKSSACNEVLVMLEKRLKQGARHWRNVSKALTVCKYMLVHGSPSITAWAERQTSLFQHLSSVNFGRPEQSKNVQELAKHVLELIASPEKRASEKEAYNRTREQVRTSIGRSSTSRHTLDIVRNLEQQEDLMIRHSDVGRMSLSAELGAIQEES